MISTVEFLSGPSPAAKPTLMAVTPITVFVGPNNSGKSLALRELRQFCGPGPAVATRILKRVEFSGLSQEEVEATLSSLKARPRRGYDVQAEKLVIRRGNNITQTSVEAFAEMLRSPPRNLDGDDGGSSLLRQYLALETLVLDGETRTGLTNHQPAGDLGKPPETSFQVLFRDDARRALLQRIVEEAFGAYLILDPTDLGHLRLRLSDVPPTDARYERSLHDDAVRFFGAATPIEQASDGVRAFVGILAEIIAGDPEIVIVDEPEAFLHPPLASKLAREMALAASKVNKRLFVATHSSEFVMGCVQSGVPVNIIRLTYQAGQGSARVLENAELIKLMRNPLLRSAGVLSALFYESVVVTEGDADRAFYEEINLRLLRGKPEWGIPDCLFLHAQNKQTVHQIIRPLRELGIAAVGIVDIDVVKDGGSTWSSLLEGANVPGSFRQTLGTWRAQIKQLLEASGKCMKREGGISILEPPDREVAKQLLDQLQVYGLFVVRGGELESWLPALKASGHGPAWLIEIFQKMGENPQVDGYVRPSGDDVWRFIRTVGEWLCDPLRKGMPS